MKISYTYKPSNRSKEACWFGKTTYDHQGVGVIIEKKLYFLGNRFNFEAYILMPKDVIGCNVRSSVSASPVSFWNNEKSYFFCSDTDEIWHEPTESLFLDAPSHLYMRSCPSVGPSVGPSVRRSVPLFLKVKSTHTRRILCRVSGLVYSALPTISYRWRLIGG